MKRITVLLILFITGFNTFPQTLQIEWQSCFGGSDSDKARDIIAIDTGYLIAGSTKSNDGDIAYNHGATDCWLIKIDNSGNIVWEKTFGGSNGDGIFRIFPTEDNNFYLLCSSYSSDGDISNDPYPESTDFWIVKIDSSGNILWDRILGGNILDQMWTGTLTDDGGVVAFGWTGSPDGDVSTYFGAYDMWMVKLNSEGETEWDFTIGTNDFDFGQAIIQTSDGGFLVGGASTIGEGGNLTCEPFNYNAEAILVKLDADRNIEWQQCYGGSDHDGILGLHELDDGYLFSAYGGSSDGDLTGSGWHGADDVWVVRIDSFGNIVWQKCYGGSNYDHAYNIFTTENGGFMLAGRTESQDGDVVGNHSLSEYDNDIWLIKISSEGELLWQQCIGGEGNEMIFFGVLRKNDNNFVIAGQTDWGPSYDVQCTPNSIGGIPDFWVFEVKDTTVSIIDNIYKQNKLSVYPNPAKDKMTVRLPNSTLEESPWDSLTNRLFYHQYYKNSFLRIYDVLCKQVKEVALINQQENKLKIDVSELPPGIYLINLYKNEKKLASGKFIINK